MLLLLVIIAIVILVGAINPRFFAVKNIVAILQQITVAGILTMGMAMLLLSGGIDLSIGNIMILSGCVMAQILKDAGKSGQPIEEAVPFALAAGLGLAIVAGFINGLIISKSRCMPLIVSLGMSGIYYGFALLITAGDYMTFKMAFEPLRSIKFFDAVPLTMLIFLFVVVVSLVLVNRTKFGRRIVAIGGNEENARLSGIRVDRYKILTYTISGLFCGIAAICYAARLDSIVSSGGNGYELIALTGAIIGGVTFDGGKGSIIGAFLGVFFMGLVSNAMNILSVPSDIQVILNGVIVVAAVLVSNIENMRRK